MLPLENGHGSYGEGVFEGRFFQFREDDGEKGEELALEVFSFCHEFVAEFREFPEGLDKFFGDLALDIFPRSQELAMTRASISSVLAFLAKASRNFWVW